MENELMESSKKTTGTKSITKEGLLKFLEDKTDAPTEKRGETKTKISRTNELTDVYELLKAPFPEEAYSADRSRGDIVLTSLKAQYVVERLNEVLGIDGWNLTGEYKDYDQGVLFMGTFKFKVGEKSGSVENVGFSPHKKLLGDAYKGAKTDCLSKCASYIGVGNEMFKGLIAPPGVAATSTVTNTNAVQSETSSNVQESQDFKLRSTRKFNSSRFKKN